MTERKKIVEIAKLLGFPEEAIAYLSEYYGKIAGNEDLLTRLETTTALFVYTDTLNYKQPLEEIAERIDVSRYTVDMIMLLLTVELVRARYRERGIDDEVCIATMTDLKYKLLECKRVYGVWGCFVTWWFRNHVSLRLFALGRLQYEPIAFPFDAYKGILKKGDKVYSCHVPASGALTEESVYDSFEYAYRFFGCKGVLPIYCSSWLIYPLHAELYKEGSNLKRFYKMFDIIGERSDEKMNNFWRIFDVPYSPEALEKAPENTALQRAFKKYFAEGGTMGDGQGVILFDGKKII